MLNDVGVDFPEGCLCTAAASLSPILLNESVRSRRSFAYRKLPPQLLKLSVLKLDGSVFEVKVSRSVTVAELKEAVEDVFSQLPKHKETDISWSHVWGQFCLSYDGQKLIDDKTYIRLLGIKDGDQLRFIRHSSTNNEREKRIVPKHRRFKGYNEQVLKKKNLLFIYIILNFLLNVYLWDSFLVKIRDKKLISHSLFYVYFS
ncbi:hypothetical protein UlMin_003017 [Ulmus minor]